MNFLAAFAFANLLQAQLIELQQPRTSAWLREAENWPGSWYLPGEMRLIASRKQPQFRATFAFPIVRRCFRRVALKRTLSQRVDVWSSDVLGTESEPDHPRRDSAQNWEISQQLERPADFQRF